MKITNVTAIPLIFPYEKPIMDALYYIKYRQALLIKIETDIGVYGIGEAACFGGPPETTKVVVEKELAPNLIGEDPLKIEWIWQKLYRRSIQHGRRGIVMCAISGVDIALWDILGKVSNMPVYKLLGGFKNKIQAYASGGFYAENKGENELVEEMSSYVRKGFKAVKMKVGRTPQTAMNPIQFMPENEIHTSVEEDIKRVQAVRKAIGNDITLMVDANGAWDVHTALVVGRELEKMKVYWIEEPTSTDDIKGSAHIADQLDILVTGYETEQGIYGFRELIINEAVDVVQPDLTWSGGFTECYRISSMAYAYNKMCVPHSFSSVVAIAASLHFLASIPNGKFLEFDQNPNALRTELSKDAFTIDNEGYVYLTDKPGLGIELREDIINKYRID
jgi:L-alanine-DL-glutamate epimerase-like enolase superfamily enzyme